ncbi:MAG TPA: hypothetical protein DCM05_15010 [Elusimicrobia bacterium]|nr:hypothetical protein [Elusimicrobiota bacterium]
MTLTLLLAALFSSSAYAAETWDARITRFEGAVTVFTSEEPKGIAPEEDMPVDRGDRIVTGKDGTIELALESESLIEIGPDSDFKLEDLDKKSSWFQLTLGSMKAKLKALMKGSRMRVRSSGATASVRGTEFAMEVPEEGETHVGVFDEGRVSVGSDEDEDGVTLSPNQETSVLAGKAPEPPQELKRFLPVRERIVHLRERREAVRARWKSRTQEERASMRRLVHERFRENLKRNPELRKKMKDGVERRKGDQKEILRKLKEKQKEQRRGQKIRLKKKPARNP